MRPFSEHGLGQSATSGSSCATGLSNTGSCHWKRVSVCKLEVVFNDIEVALLHEVGLKLLREERIVLAVELRNEVGEDRRR